MRESMNLCVCPLRSELAWAYYCDRSQHRSCTVPSVLVAGCDLVSKQLLCMVLIADAMHL
jgi:hypothetical protein